MSENTTDLTILSSGASALGASALLPSCPTREQVERLQDAMSQFPQEEVITDHYFNGGMYCRKVSRKAGTLIVGKVHKIDHFFLCAAGSICVWTEAGMKTLNAGDVIESKAGTKRATLALTDSIGITFHRTDKTDLKDLEDELIEPDSKALFDFENKIILKISSGDLS